MSPSWGSQTSGRAQRGARESAVQRLCGLGGARHMAQKKQVTLTSFFAPYACYSCLARREQN